MIHVTFLSVKYVLVYSIGKSNFLPVVTSVFGLVTFMIPCSSHVFWSCATFVLCVMFSLVDFVMCYSVLFFFIRCVRLEAVLRRTIGVTLKYRERD